MSRRGGIDPVACRRTRTNPDGFPQTETNLRSAVVVQIPPTRRCAAANLEGASEKGPDLANNCGLLSTFLKWVEGQIAAAFASTNHSPVGPRQIPGLLAGGSGH